jgi:hypothetical protein
MSNDINALRDVLFATLRGIKDGSVELDKAKAINDTAQTIINTAKVEVDFMRQVGTPVGSSFMPAAIEEPKPSGSGSSQKPKPYVGTPIRGALSSP